MDRLLTLFLRFVVVVVGVVLVLICSFPLRHMLVQEASKSAGSRWPIYVFLVGAYLQALLVLFALFQVFKILGYVANNQTFSKMSVAAFRRIKFAATGVGVLMIVGLGWLGVVSHGTDEDGAGPAMLGFIGTFVSCATAATAALVQSQVKKMSEGKVNASE